MVNNVECYYAGKEALLKQIKYGESIL